LHGNVQQKQNFADIEIEKEIEIDIVILIDIEMDIARYLRAGLGEKRESFFLFPAPPGCHCHGGERQWGAFSFEKRKRPIPPKEKRGGVSTRPHTP